MLVRCTALCSLALALGCVPLPPAAVNSSLQATDGLRAANPSNIAVVPVEDGTRGGNARDVLETFRQEMYAALVQRRYVPLSSRVVDPVVREQAAAVANASLTRPEVLARVAGHLNEDAVLAVRITAWDESRVMANARVRFGVEATMISSSTKAVLWSGGLDGEVKAGREGAAPRYRDERVLDCTKQIARAMISQLPERS
jgi:hypothetical protein